MVDIIFIILILIFLILIHERTVHKWKFLEKIRTSYVNFDRKNRNQNYIDRIKRKPIDRQEVIVKDLSILIFIILIALILVTKTIFFASVLSGSMAPTLQRNDIVLMQNIDRRYEIGDIIIFKSPDRDLPITHRIVSIDDDNNIQTSGDAIKRTDWWKLKKEDVMGKAILILGRPIVIKDVGKYFIIEDKNKQIGPFDYSRYILFISLVKTYGYAIVAICLIAYVILTFKRDKKEMRWK